jgi:hypothetical protein
VPVSAFRPSPAFCTSTNTPEGVADSFSIVFTYKKNGKELEFDQANFPADFDSTYEYIDRHDKLVKKGNGLQPKIVDFSLQTLDGADTTAGIFAQANPYILVMAKDMDHTADWMPGFEKIFRAAQQKNIPVILVTADAGKAVTIFKNIRVLKCDATVLKTAARATPTYFLMQQASVINKFSYADADKVLQEINILK